MNHGNMVPFVFDFLFNFRFCARIQNTVADNSRSLLIQLRAHWFCEWFSNDIRFEYIIISAAKYCLYRFSFLPIPFETNRYSLFVISSKNITFHMHKHYIFEKQSKGRQATRQADKAAEAVLRYSITCHSKLEKFQCKPMKLFPIRFHLLLDLVFFFYLVVVAILPFSFK